MNGNGQASSARRRRSFRIPHSSFAVQLTAPPGLSYTTTAMPLLTVESLTKYYGTELILDSISFSFDHRERLGLIGANGSGKTTLCKILMGLEPYEDNSRLYFARGMTAGYLSQDVNFGAARTPWEVVMALYPQMREMEAQIAAAEARMAEAPAAEEREAAMEEHAHLLTEYEAAGGYEYERRAAAVLDGLGVPPAAFHRDLLSFSGGEQRRVALAQLLLTQPDLLLLDEPTNHLDLAGTEWLEGFLRGYPGAVIAISHDRWFLDAVAQRILELDCGKLAEYRGGYSDYVKQKEQRLLTYERTYERQQEELQRQLSFIRWALATQQEKKVKAAKSRLKLLDKVEWLDPPPAQRRQMSLRFKPRARGGDEILELTHLTKGYGAKALFGDVNLLIRRGERVGVVGPNGCGKTTLLRVALGLERPTSGHARLGASVQVGYHRQEEFDLNPQARVYDEFKTVVPEGEEGEIRSLLARFLFVGDDILQRVGDLSGGEQSRLSLAKLVMTQPTLLVLDEPTNHLDLDSRSALEAALRDYEGTVLVVSHDRYLLDNVVSRLLVFEGGGTRVYGGNYSAYLAARRAERERRELLAAEQREAVKQERFQQERRTRKEKKRRAAAGQAEPGEALPPISELEERARELERRLARITSLLGDPDTYSLAARVDALNLEHTRLSAELAQVYDLWERADRARGGSP